MSKYNFRSEQVFYFSDRDNLIDITVSFWMCRLENDKRLLLWEQWPADWESRWGKKAFILVKWRVLGSEWPRSFMSWGSRPPLLNMCHTWHTWQSQACCDFDPVGADGLNHSQPILMLASDWLQTSLHIAAIHPAAHYKQSRDRFWKRSCKNKRGTFPVHWPLSGR